MTRRPAAVSLPLIAVIAAAAVQVGCAGRSHDPGAGDPTKRPLAIKPADFAMIEIVSSAGIARDVAVNGFPTADLTRIGAATGGVPIGFDTAMEEYTILHPYFIRPGENRVTATYRLAPTGDEEAGPGPWSLALRVASVRYPIDGEYWSKRYVDRELATFSSPALDRSGDPATEHTLAGSFEWKGPMPAWAWTHGEPIEDSPQTRASLYDAYQRFHDGLAGMHVASADAPPTGFIDGVRASMREFIAASELRGKPYTYLDDLAYAATRLTTPDFEAQEQRNAEKQKRKPEPTAPVDDGPGPDTIPPDADGTTPPRLGLSKLPAADGLVLTVFAGGALAKLTKADADPLIELVNNGYGGAWGHELHSPVMLVEVWFRRSGDTWSVDALWSKRGVPETMPGNSLDNLMGGDEYWGAR